MTIDDLIVRYDDYKKRYGVDACKKISKLLDEAKYQHRIDFLVSKTAKKAIAAGRQPDHEQSWRAFKGKNLEKLIIYIIRTEIESLGLKIADGNSLERTTDTKLSLELTQVKRNLLVDYGEFGCFLPDVDIVIYEPLTQKVLAVISSKVTLRERIAQTGYWKLKLFAAPFTKHIKVYFITPDEDGDFTHASRGKIKKGRAIVEGDLDGSYILCENPIEESSKVKTFDKFISDLKAIIKS